jgi:hypothetical protein
MYSISETTDLGKENYWVICEPLATLGVTYQILIKCCGLSVNCRNLKSCSRESIGKGECDPTSEKVGELLYYITGCCWFLTFANKNLQAGSVLSSTGTLNDGTRPFERRVQREKTRLLWPHFFKQLHTQYQMFWNPIKYISEQACSSLTHSILKM